MIIVQTPLRVSFFGGGTDFREFIIHEGGCVLSSAIDKYIFVTIKKRFDSKLRIGYTQTEMVDEINQQIAATAGRGEGEEWLKWHVRLKPPMPQQLGSMSESPAIEPDLLFIETKPFHP